MTLFHIEYCTVNLNQSVEQVSSSGDDLHAFLAIVERKVRDILYGLVLERLYKLTIRFYAVVHYIASLEVISKPKLLYSTIAHLIMDRNKLIKICLA